MKYEGIRSQFFCNQIVCTVFVFVASKGAHDVVFTKSWWWYPLVYNSSRVVALSKMQKDDFVTHSSHSLWRGSEYCTRQNVEHSDCLVRPAPPRAPKKAAERGRGPGSTRERKNWNVRRVVAPANVPVIRNYPILSDFFRKLTRVVHRRGIYSRTAIRTAFSPSCHSTMPPWMHYSGNSIWRLIYSCGLPQGESVLSIRAGEIQFDDD